MGLAACLSQVPSSVPRFMVPVSLMTPMLVSRSSRRMRSPVPAAGVPGAFAAAAGEAQLTGNPNSVQRLGGSQGRRQTGPPSVCWGRSACSQVYPHIGTTRNSLPKEG